MAGRPVVDPIVRLGCGPLEFVSGDEALLPGTATHVRVATLAERCLSLGVGVRGRRPATDRAVERGLAVVRRRTGGTALLHEPGELVWTVVLGRSDPRVGGALTEAYRRLGAGVVRWLDGRGVAAAWVPAPALVEEYCTLSSRGSVLAVDGRVLGGAAQHLTGDRLLHQGVVSVSLDRPSLSDLFGEALAVPSHRLTSLTELGVVDEPPRLARSLAATIADTVR